VPLRGGYDFLALPILPFVNDYSNEEDDDDGGGDGDGDNGDSNDNNSYSEDVQISDILVTTKSGRTCRTWRGRYLNYLFC